MFYLKFIVNRILLVLIILNSKIVLFVEIETTIVSDYVEVINQRVKD